ncbi:hypothetical protein VNO80_04256 [Phaseolus coccineus]
MEVREEDGVTGRKNLISAIRDPWALEQLSVIFRARLQKYIEEGNIASEVRFWFWHFRGVNQIFFVTVISHLITMSRSGQPPDLKKYMDKKLQIKLNANRMIVGTLRGFDQFMNLVVDNTVEVNGNEKTDIGMVVIRGNSVVTVEALEPVNRT